MKANDRTSFIRACVIGALVFAAVYAFLPDLWWLAGLASFAAGYVSFRFRDVLLAVPQALRQMGRKFGNGYGWAKRTSPLDRLVIMGGLLGLLAGNACGAALMREQNPQPLIIIVLFFAIFSISFGVSGIILTFVSVSLGAERVERCFWPGLPEWEEKYLAQGLIKKPLTWPNVLRWLGKGIFWGLRFYVSWWMRLLRAILVFPWKMVKLIHGKERVLAGIDGAAAGALGCWFFHEPEMGFVALAMLFAASGIIGLAIGTCHYRLAQFIQIRFVAAQTA